MFFSVCRLGKKELGPTLPSKKKSTLSLAMGSHEDSNIGDHLDFYSDLLTEGAVAANLMEQETAL